MGLYDALWATWPPAETRRVAGFTLRRGEGGGNRVSAATLEPAAGPPDIAAAEAGMRAWGEAPIFMIRPGEEALDAALAARGYRTHGAALVLTADPAALAPPEPDPRVIGCTAPLAVMRALWAAGGVGPARLAVLARAPQPKTFLLGRAGDRPAACGFVAVAGATAMLHALEVAPFARRQGLGSALTRAAAAFALTAGATRFALDVACDNPAARALYAGLGLTPASAYHYRLAPEPDPEQTI